jgi:hypothetical protein
VIEGERKGKYAEKYIENVQKDDFMKVLQQNSELLCFKCLKHDFISVLTECINSKQEKSKGEDQISKESIFIHEIEYITRPPRGLTLNPKL